MAPRAALSGTTDVDTIMPLADDPGPGNWRVDLLYAELAFLDASAPSKGTQVTILWATAPASAPVTGPAPFAAPPPDTPLTWYVPIAFVRNVGGASAVTPADIWECPGDTGASFLGNLHARIAAKKTGLDVRRGFSSQTHDPRHLMIGGTSALAGAAGMQALTATRTSASIGRFDVEECIRTFFIPGELVIGTAGATVLTPIDDTRNWLGAEFLTFWVVPQGVRGSMPGLDDPGATIPEMRHLPAPRSMWASKSSAIFVATGHSYDPYKPAAPMTSERWAAVVGPSAQNGSINGVPELLFSKTSFVGLLVGADGVLNFACNTDLPPGWTPGPGLWVKVFATFTRARG
jgi:hypothetical protein